MARILVVDDEALVRTLTVEVGARLGHEVAEAGTLAEGLRAGSRGVDVVLLDVLLPDGNGLERIQEFAALPGRPELVIVTGYGDGDVAETALRSGAWEFLTKPLRVRELSQALAQIVACRLQRRSQNGGHMDRGHILGSSKPLLEALDKLKEAAASDVNVLLLGETGVGKEMFAKALHRNSARAGQPFVTVDCASLPETLVESHLFGHARGAFTGAERARDGLLLAANRGTLFLDEVGDLPMSMQGAFLRALELRRFRPIGEVREVPSDFRLVAATNRRLEEMVRASRFRSDLLYRLQGVSIYIPPLRERRGDIPELARHAVLRFCVQHEQPVQEMADSCVECLLNYHWPGNVRELLHAMEWACVAAGGAGRIFPGHLPTDIRVAVARGRVNCGRSRTGGEEPSAPSGFPEEIPSLKEWKSDAEREYVRRLMLHCRSDIRKAAGLAGLSRGHMYELLKKHDRPTPA